MTCGILIPVGSKFVLASGSRVLSDTQILPNSRKILDFPGGYTALVAGYVADEREVWNAASLLDEFDPDSIAQLVQQCTDNPFELIIAREGEAWLIYNDGFCAQLTEPATIGTGGPMAKGFLAASPKPRTVEKAEKLALKCLRYVSSQYACEGPPFYSTVI